jgi:glutamine amidotransferase
VSPITPSRFYGPGAALPAIGIIDYGMGNLRSVQKAFELVGASAQVLAHPDEIVHVDRLVLPGIGAFGDGMINLRKGGWIAPIKAFIERGRPFLGICLGMQLLFESSMEDAASPHEPVQGLGILPGRVVQFDVNHGSQRIKVPHMGWNTLRWSTDDPLLAGLPQESAVYFVHSFYCVPDESAGRITSAATQYPAGEPFTSTLWSGNTWATQFHPEKSQRTGLRMLRNFAMLEAGAKLVRA